MHREINKDQLLIPIGWILMGTLSRYVGWWRLVCAAQIMTSPPASPPGDITMVRF
jgi:hypothetical protein